MSNHDGKNKRLSAHAAAELAATAEICGAQMSKIAANMLDQDLAEYPEDAVINALRRCRRELKHRLTLADIVERIEEVAPDGWPSPNEAWAAVGTLDEWTTLVGTREAFEARATVTRTPDDGGECLLQRDEVAARMAFIESYRRLVARAKAEGRRPEWSASLGWDKPGRERALREAVEKGQLTPAQAHHCFGVPVPGLALPPADRLRLGPVEASPDAKAAAAARSREFKAAMEGGPDALKALQAKLEAEESQGVSIEPGEVSRRLRDAFDAKERASRTTPVLPDGGTAAAQEAAMAEFRKRQEGGQ